MFDYIKKHWVDSFMLNLIQIVLTFKLHICLPSLGYLCRDHHNRLVFMMSMFIPETGKKMTRYDQKSKTLKPQSQTKEVQYSECT